MPACDFPSHDPPALAHLLTQAMLRHARTVVTPHNNQPTNIRIGIHTGSVVR